MKIARAIFLDRDGVINVNLVDNVRTWEQFVFETGALDALARLAAADFRLLVITNQAGIGLGQMTHATVEEIHARMIQEIGRAGGRIDGVYICPHTRQDQCSCRKPSPELLLRARDDFSLDLARSYFIGDWVADVGAARNAGVTPLLVRTGRGEDAVVEMRARGIEMAEVLQNFGAAVDWILERE